MAALVGFLLLGCGNSTSPTPHEPGLPPLASHIHNAFVNGICTHPGCNMIEMRPLPAGTLTRRSEAEGELHTITLSGFNMMVFEVTQELFQAVMGHNPSIFGDDPAAGEEQGRRPVENVTWFEAVEFANRLSERHGRTPVYTIEGTNVTANWGADGYRLPTEAEWEYANRAGSNAAWDWHFENQAVLGYYAWFNAGVGNTGHAYGMTRQVGQKQPNAWGLYDTHGNVWEWVWDWADWGGDGPAWPGTFPVASATNPRGPDAGSVRVIRGGSFVITADYTHSAFRSGITPEDRFNDLGFRLVRP